SNPRAAVMLPTGSRTSNTNATPAMTLQGTAIHHGTPGLIMRASRGRLIAASPGHEVLPLYAGPAGRAKANLAPQNTCVLVRTALPCWSTNLRSVPGSLGLSNRARFAELMLTQVAKISDPR